MRFSTGLLAWVLFMTLNLPLFQDARRYEEIGYSITQDWLSGRSSVWLDVHGSEAHQPIVMILGIACFYTLTVGLRILPLLLAAYASITSYTPVVIYKLSKEFGASKRASKYTANIVTFMPIFIFWSGALYKEGLILLSLSFALLHTIKLQKKWSARSLTLVILNLVLLAGLRTYLAVIVTIALLFGSLLGNAKNRSSSARVSMVLRQLGVFTVFAVLMVLVAYAVDVQKIFPEDFESGMHQIQISRSDLANAKSGYLPEADISTPWKAVKFMPMGTACFLCLPMPWHLGSLRQNMAIPDSAIWLALYPVVLIGMYLGSKKNLPGSFVLILTTVGILSLYSIFISNIGTAYRLRTQVLLIWTIFAGIGLDYLKIKFGKNKVRRFSQQPASSFGQSSGQSNSKKLNEDKMDQRRMNQFQMGDHRK